MNLRLWVKIQISVFVFLYFFSTFVTWDFLWIKDIPEWLGLERFFLALVLLTVPFASIPYSLGVGKNDTKY